MNTRESGRSTPEHDTSFRRNVRINIAKGVAVLFIVAGGIKGGEVIGNYERGGASTDAAREAGNIALGIVTEAIFVFPVGLLTYVGNKVLHGQFRNFT